MKILVIDDEVVSRKKLQIILNLVEGCDEVILASSGDEGVGIAWETLPDLILLDVMMPDVNGYQVITTLKNDVRTKDIPVIFISGLDSLEDEGRGLMLGAVDYITKPFYPPIVKARVGNHLQYIHQRNILEQEASIDSLTSMPNRRSYDKRIQEEWDRSLRSETALSIALLDIDFFKPFNDNYGHAEGDAALKAVAKSILTTIKRSADFCARFGGEEFVVIFPCSDAVNSYQMADSIRQSVENLNLKHEFSAIKDIVTISIGGATCIPGKEMKLDSFIKKADEMLYEAKGGGRNRVIWNENNLF